MRLPLPLPALKAGGCRLLLIPCVSLSVVACPELVTLLHRLVGSD